MFFTEYELLLMDLQAARKKLDKRRELLFDLSTKCVSVANGLAEGINYDTEEGKKAIRHLTEDIEIALGDED
jgi:hypothetical protein